MAGQRPGGDPVEPSGLRVLVSGCGFLEVPRWHHGQLWVLDMVTARIVTVDPDGSCDQLAVPGVPVGLGWTPDDQLLVLTRDGRLLRRDPAGLVTLTHGIAGAAAPCNELTVDAAGRVFVGVFGLTRGALLRVHPEGTTTVVAVGLLLPNGQALTPDGRTLIVAESAGQRLTAFDITADGELHHRRVWASFGPAATATTLPGVLAQVRVWPDGIALDAAGGVWVADPLGQQVLRVAPDGVTVTDRISTAPLGCYGCALGGPARDTLVLCAAPPGQDEDTHRRRPGSRLLTGPAAVPAAP